MSNYLNPQNKPFNYPYLAGLLEGLVIGMAYGRIAPKSGQTTDDFLHEQVGKCYAAAIDYEETGRRRKRITGIAEGTAI